MAAQSKRPRKSKDRHTIRLQHAGFRSYAWFNRFEIQSSKEGKLVYFGMIIGGRIVSQVAVLLGWKLLTENRDGNLSYFERMNVGQLNEHEITEIEQWRPDVHESEVFVPSLMRMGHADEEAEISFYGLAFSALIGLDSSSELDSDPLVAVRSRVEIQRHFIEQIYVD